MRPIAEFTGQLDQPKEIVITTHPNPDADALGSSLGLAHFLRGRGHRVTIITPTDFPEFLLWMPGSDEIICYRDDKEEEIKAHFRNAEIVFCLDFSSLNRMKGLEVPFRTSSGTKVLIDHHLEPEKLAEYQLSDNTAAATAELIYALLLMMKGQEEITPAIANCIYAGIMTDTGSFKHPSTTAKVHRTVAELIDLGANVNMVNREIYDTNSLNRLRFIGYALLEKLVVKKDLQVAYFVISSQDFERFQIKNSDTEGLVNYALSIKGIIMATIIIEREDEIKLSFRSVGEYSVNTFAQKYFEGGGHKNASGGSSNDSLEKTLSRFEDLIVDYKEKYLAV